jgi:hypothetical protein
MAHTIKSDATNPPISDLLRRVTALEVVVLVVTGGGLFFFPGQIARIWPWQLLPFNTRFLGGVYLGALVAATLLVAFGHWSPARVVIPMILIFTVMVLAVSLIYFERFERGWATGLWFLLYIGLPVNAAYHIWQYWDLAPTMPQTVPSWLRRLACWRYMHLRCWSPRNRPAASGPGSWIRFMPACIA